MAQTVSSLRLVIDTSESEERIERLHRAIRDFAAECEAINARGSVSVAMSIDLHPRREVESVFERVRENRADCA